MFTCSSCKKSFDSAWSLIQHAEKLHGIQCCLENDLAKPDQSQPSIAPHDLLSNQKKAGVMRPPPEYRPPVSRSSMATSGPTYFPPHIPPSLYPLLPGLDPYYNLLTMPHHARQLSSNIPSHLSLAAQHSLVHNSSPRSWAAKKTENPHLYLPNPFLGHQRVKEERSMEDLKRRSRTLRG